MESAVRTPTHLWIVGGLSALWNAFGATDYTMTQTQNPAWMAQLTQAQRDYIASFPAWAEAGWALGVWGALIGSLLLLMRSRHAVTAFIVSLVGLAVTTLFQHVLSSPPPEMAGGGAVALSLFIWAVAIALLLYALNMRKRGVLR